jgi:hypothetical protein
MPDTEDEHLDDNTKSVLRVRDRLEAVLGPIEAAGRRELGAAGLATIQMVNGLRAVGQMFIDEMHGVKPVEMKAHENVTGDNLGDDDTNVGSRNELADSKPTNPIETAALASVLNPGLGIPKPIVGGSQMVSPIIEVTAPQSLPTPKPGVKTGGPVPDAAIPTVGSQMGDALVKEAVIPEDPNPGPIAVIPVPVEHAVPEIETEDTAPSATVTAEGAPKEVTDTLEPSTTDAERLF